MASWSGRQDDEPLIDVDSAGFPVMLVVVVVVLAGVSILVYRTYCRKSFVGARATLCRWLRSRIHSRCGCGVCAESVPCATKSDCTPPPPLFPCAPVVAAASHCRGCCRQGWTSPKAM